MAATSSTPFISEIHYDNVGTDTGEFVEVQVPEASSVQGWKIVLYNGDPKSRAAYSTQALPAQTPGSSVVTLTYPSNGIQNGSPDGLALVDDKGAVVEFLSYEGTFTAADGPAVGRTSTDIGVAETGSEPAEQSLSRRLDPVTGNYEWQGPAEATPGQQNPALGSNPPPPGTDVCDAAPTDEIGAVQGEGDTSPKVGKLVTVRGVVVGDEPGLGGFYLQDADGDNNPATSDGIFVYSPVPVGLGDTVAATGGVKEFNGLTEIVSNSDVAVCTAVTGDPTAALPPAAPLDLPADDAARERLEGMRVAPVDQLTVSEVYALTRYGELTLSEGGVLVQKTEAARPGPAAEQVEAENGLRSIVLDDGTNASTSATKRPYLSPDTPVRVGDQLTFTSPLVLGYGFGTWRLEPADGTPEGTFAAQNSRPAAPRPVGGDVHIGTFNVLNYFVSRGPEARGAKTDAEFAEQSSKIVSAIGKLDADVVSLLEIEDTDSTGYTPGNPDTALADLTSKLNAAAGSDEWAYVPMPRELLTVDRDVIRNGIIYKKAVVVPDGAPAGLVDESVWSNAREPIAQTFVKDGDRFTVIANHFKSKSPGSPSGDNIDTGDGQGEWNGDRVRQARSVADFADRLRRQTGDPDVLLLGDLNAYSKEDPIETLRTAGYTDLGETRDPGRHSYVYDARSGSLDHALASPDFAGKVTGVTHWNINSVESFAYQYSGDPALYAPNPYRASDHDPLLIGLDLTETCDGRKPTIVGTNGPDVLRGTNGPDVIMGLGGDDVVDGANGDDVICGGAGNDRVAGGNGNDQLLGGLGDDTLHGDNGDDHLIGGPGNDHLDGGRGNNAVEEEGPES